MAETVRLTLFTLGVAAAATLWILPPGIFLGWALARRGWRGRSAVEALVSLPLVLPPTAIGLGLLLLLGRDGPLGGPLHDLFGVEIAFTWKAVVIASGVVAFPLLVRSVRAALEEVDPKLLGVARTLGRGPLGTFLSVHLPLAWRGVLAGAVLAFARALGEFGATILVAGNIPGRTRTLALAVFQEVQVGREGRAVALAGVSAALAFAAMLGVEWLTGRRERKLTDDRCGARPMTGAGARPTTAPVNRDRPHLALGPLPAPGGGGAGTGGGGGGAVRSGQDGAAGVDRRPAPGPGAGGGGGGGAAGFGGRRASAAASAGAWATCPRTARSSRISRCGRTSSSVARGGAMEGSGWTTWWPPSIYRTFWAAGPATSRAASAAGSPWAGRCWPAPACCSWTSPPPASTRSTPAGRWPRCGGSTTSWGCPCWW